MAGKLNIIERLPIAAVTSGGGEASVQNLLTNDPKEIFQATAVNRGVYIDMGAVVTVDSFFAGFTNGDTGSVRPFTATNGAGAGAVALAPAAVIRAADCKTARSSRLIRLAAPVASRYFTMDFSGNAVNWQIGAIGLGLAFEAEWDREWGSGRRPIDTGRSTALLGGGFGTQEGARKASYSWTFGDLTETELETLWGIFLRTGTTNPVIVNEVDGATVGANEKLHYGLFQRLDPFERREPNATKWGMEVEEWI